MFDPVEDAVRVYQMGDVEVWVPRSLAADVHGVAIEFQETDHFGVHAKIVSTEGTVADFPWWDEADADLAAKPDGWAPMSEIDGRLWEDLDQGWCLSVTTCGDAVFVFQSDFDELQALTGSVTARASDELGIVLAQGVRATWFRIPAGEYQAAWRHAQLVARSR